MRPGKRVADSQNHRPVQPGRQVRWTWQAWLAGLLWLPLLVLAWLAQRGLAQVPAWVETHYTLRIFRVLAAPLIWLNSLVPVSLAEITLIAGGPLMILAVVVWLVQLVRQPHRWQRLGRGLRGFAWLVTVVYWLFMLLHGFNYARLPVAVSFDLPVMERPAADLAETARWLLSQAAVTRTSCLEDADGVFVLRQGVRGVLAEANAGYDLAVRDWPRLAGTRIRPKGVWLSHYWSFTGITGVYFPILAEANVNIDQPDYAIPDTIGHEIAHTRGFAREDEAGFVSFLTGLVNPDPDFQYSVLINAAIHLTNALYSYDRDAYDQVMQAASPAIWRDLRAGQVYWQQFAGPVQETSNQLNNAYLQANLQTDGVRSYGRMIDLVLAWYQVEKAAGRLTPAGT